MTVGFVLIVAAVCGLCSYFVVRDFQKYEEERAERIRREAEELRCKVLNSASQVDSEGK